MMANGRGFLHDFDYAFNWRAFLYANKWQDTLASWEHYVQNNEGIGRQDTDNGDGPAIAAKELAPAAVQHKAGSDEAHFVPPLPVINKAGHKEYYVDAILAERPASNKGRRKEYLVRWRGYPEPTWEPPTYIRLCEPFLQWKAQTEEERIDLSRGYYATRVARPPTDRTGTIEDETGFLRDSRSRSECKQRTVSTIFLA